MNSNQDWLNQVLGLIQMVEKCMGIRIKQDSDCVNVIFNSEYEKVREFFERGIGRFSEYVLNSALILPPRSGPNMARYEYKDDLGNHS